MDSRVPLLEIDEISNEIPKLVESVELDNLNIFRVMGNNLSATEGMLNYTKKIYNELSERDREIVILTVARITGSKYEWHQHVKLSLDQNILKKDIIDKIGREKFNLLEKKERVISNYTESYIEEEITDSIHNTLKNYYSDREIVAIGLLCSLYLGLAKLIKAFRIPLEENFIGWTFESN